MMRKQYQLGDRIPVSDGRVTVGQDSDRGVVICDDPNGLDVGDEIDTTQELRDGQLVTLARHCYRPYPVANRGGGRQ